MIKVNITNAAVFKAQVAAWAEGVNVAGGIAVTKMMKDAQLQATLLSPVYSGDFASNWNVKAGSPDTTFSSSGGDYMRVDSNLRTHPLTSSVSVTPGNFNMSGFKLGQTAYLSNSAAHDEPYAWKIEDNKINFRPINQGKHRVRGKTLDYLGVKYKQITKAMMV